MNNDHMRQEFYAWHGGMSSALYAAASSGLVADIGALQAELIQCARDLDNRHLMPNHSAAKYKRDKREAVYLRAVANSLPSVLSRPFTYIDGREYRALPWAKLPA